MIPDWLQRPWQGGLEVSPLDTVVHLLAALGAGGAVILIRKMRRPKDAPPDNGLGTTLVLLCILAALVTQVIGNNVARAFGLVGALAIVRFRTPIEDSRDTAFVMFAMVIGMAVGSGFLVVAAIGIGVVAVACGLATLLSGSEPITGRLDIRIPPGGEPDLAFAGPFGRFFTSYRLTATSTAKEGAAYDLTYHVTVRPGVEAWAIVSELSRLPGVQKVEWVLK